VLQGAPTPKHIPSQKSQKGIAGGTFNGNIKRRKAGQKRRKRDRRGVLYF
jgi:hypothetical protein